MSCPNIRVTAQGRVHLVASIQRYKNTNWSNITRTESALAPHSSLCFCWIEQGRRCVFTSISLHRSLPLTSLMTCHIPHQFPWKMTTVNLPFYSSHITFLLSLPFPSPPLSSTCLLLLSVLSPHLTFSYVRPTFPFLPIPLFHPHHLDPFISSHSPLISI